MSLHTLTEPTLDASVRPPDQPARCRARVVLQSVLLASLTNEACDWLLERLQSVASDPSQRALDMAFGLAPRRLGKAMLNPLVARQVQEPCASPPALEGVPMAASLIEPLAQSVTEMGRLIPQWPLLALRCDQAARILILARIADADEQAQRITDLLRHADMNEQIAIYRGLPLYAASPSLNDRLADGLRSNMSEVFDAIAHDNPYAAWHLDAHRFNHMVLKALFIGRALAPIVGLQRRANAELARMLLETVRERRAAGRTISDEIWPLATPFMTDTERLEFSGVMLP